MTRCSARMEVAALTVVAVTVEVEEVCSAEMTVEEVGLDSAASVQLAILG